MKEKACKYWLEDNDSAGSPYEYCGLYWKTCICAGTVKQCDFKKGRKENGNI